MKKLIKSSFIVCLFWPIFSCTATNDTLSCREAEEFLKNNANNKSIKVIDVRTPEEYAQGHLLSAININWSGSDFDKQIAKLDKNQTYIVYCKRGGRSAGALKKMHSIDIRNVKYIRGGFDEWKEFGFKYE
jgi:rhodanese-related sulfurtransferase